MSHGHEHHGHDTKAHHHQALHEHDSWFRHDHAVEGHHKAAEGETNPWGILITLFGTVVLVGVVGILCIKYFEATYRGIRRETIESNQAFVAESSEAKAKWGAQLSNYEWIDASAGQVRIPISEAEKLVIQDYANVSRK